MEIPRPYQKIKTVEAPAGSNLQATLLSLALFLGHRLARLSLAHGRIDFTSLHSATAVKVHVLGHVPFPLDTFSDREGKGGMLWDDMFTGSVEWQHLQCEC